MTDDKKKQLFLSLIYSFQMQTMMQLGKLANPVTGTIEKELDGAQVTIDMLDMLKEKTKGNSSEEEVRFLDQITILDKHSLHPPHHVSERPPRQHPSTKIDAVGEQIVFLSRQSWSHDPGEDHGVDHNHR